MNPDQTQLLCLACAERHIRRSDSYLAMYGSCRDTRSTPPKVSVRTELRMQMMVVSGALGFATVGLSVLEQLRF